ncbi:disease resistance protein RPS4B-like [Quercus lobata]|uniref:disease resistance protein RPS4B-like n=1 Tax=Quercus lobata TaxID=97700 RepID=UPI0012451737|nr:disease resistance protein RPS4B-like [Quercus lobata]
MPNLELLIIYGVHLLHGPKELPNGLRFLDWIEYPSKSLPLSFQPDKLVELHMCHSKVERLWKGKKGIYKKPKEATISTFIPGSEIMEWFSHQSMGNIVKAQVSPWKQNVIIQMPNHSCNKRMGMAACAIFSPLDLYPKNYSFFENSHIICYIEDGVGELAKFSINCVQISSHHLWLLYFRPEFFDENTRAILSQIDENESIQLEVRFQFSRD